MGAIISLAVDEVYMAENSYLMIHAPSSYSSGQAQDFENQAKLLRLIETDFIKKLQQKTGKNEEYVKQWLIGDNWFNAEQALSEGLIKGIISPEFDFDACSPKQLSIKEVFNHYKPSNNFNFNDMDLRDQLISRLKLISNTSNTNILMKVEEALYLREELKKLLELDKKVSDDEILEAVKKLLEAEQTTQEEQEAEARYLTTQAIRSGGITQAQEQHILGLFKKDFKGTKNFLNSLPKRTPPLDIAELIKKTEANNARSQEKPKSDWDLDDYRKNAPKELEQKPELYQRLIKAKYNNKN